MKQDIKFKRSDSNEISDYFEVVANSTELTKALDKPSSRNKNSILKYVSIGFATASIVMPAEILANKNVKSRILFVQNSIQDNFNLEEYHENVDFSFYLNSALSASYFTKYEVISEILSFKSLNNNWDGYGAYPLEVKSASNAILFLDLIGNDRISKIEDIFPNPHGTISFVWSNEIEETISLEIGNKTMSYYVDFANQKPLFFNKLEINAKEADKITDFLDRL